MSCKKTTTEVTYENIKRLLANAEWPLSTSQVAEEFDISQQAAYRRLCKLQERGEVEKGDTPATSLWRLAG